VAFAFGFSLLVMAYAIGPVSGCHINPAVTFGLLLSGKFEAKHVPGYVIAQIAGAILAGGVLLIIAGGTSAGYDPSTAGFAANGYGAHSPGGYNLTAAFVAEVVLTFFLVFTVLGTTDIKAPVGFAGIPIGIVLVLIHLVGIPVTNTSVNPPQYWACGVRWWMGIEPALAIHRGPAHRRGDRIVAVQDSSGF
jgi:aquaporin Z